MAQLLSGTRIYGTGTVDTQLFVNGSEQAASTNTGALQIAGGAGVGGTLFVGGASTFTGITSITNSTDAATTTTGALVVSGGAAIAKDLRVGGTIYGLINGTVIGIITTASNLSSGTRGQIPFQTDPGVTGFFGPGSTGTILVSAGANAAGPVFTSTGSIYVGRSALSDDLSGGAAGSLPYQTGADDTTFLGIGANGSMLISTGSAPQWASTSSLVVGNASQADSILMSNDVASATTQFITFVSTTTGYTTLKGSAMSGVTFKPISGNFGLGTSNPSYRLHVVEASNVTPAHIERPLGGNILELYNSSGLTTNASQLAFLHKDSSNAAVAASRISGYASALGSGAISGGITLLVSNAGTESEAVRVTHLGNFGIGVDPIYRLDVAGGARITGITTVTSVTVSTSPTTGALQISGGAGIAGNINSGGQISSTRANSTATGEGQLYLNGTTGNRIDFGTAGQASPNLGTRSVGTKIVLYPGISPSTADYGFGIESGALWSSVSSGADSFLWYAANTNIATLSGSGNLTLAGDLAVNGGDITSTQGSFNFLASGVTSLNLATAATSITIGNASAGTTTVRNNLAITTNTNSTSITDGALAVTGGVGIQGDLRVGGTIFGNVSVTGSITTATNLGGGTAGQVPYQTAPGQTSFFGPGIAGDVLVSNGTSAPTYNNTLALAGTTAATNATSGALRVSGGAGIQGDLHVGASVNGQSYIATGTSPAANSTVNFGVYSSGAWINSPTGTTAYLATAGNGVASWNGTSVVVLPTTAANSTATGALQVRGGVGIAGDVVIGGDLQVDGGDLTTNQTTFNLVDTTATTVNFARAATAITIGAASGSTTVRNNLTVAGNLTVQGTTTVVDSTVTNVSDPIFTIGTGPNGANPAADDNKDRGIAFQWHNGTSARTGFFGFDDSTGYFTFVTSATFINEIVSPAGGTTRGAVDVNLAGGATGSLPYQSAANTSVFLPIGTPGQVLVVQGGVPVWTAPSGITAGNATTVDMTNDVATTTPQFITFVGTATGAAAVKASAMSGLTFIPSSSRLGIGINTPTYPLHINVPTGLASIGLSGTAANAQTMKLMQGVTSVTNSGFSIYDDSNSATRFMIGSTGNVGIGTGTQDPTDRLHVSNSGGTASLRVGDTASTQAGLILQRRSGGIDTQVHWFNASANNPWYHFGQSLLWTGERAGTVTPTLAARPYYEAFAPSVGYKEFGFVNVTSGAFTSSNMISSLALKNDGTVGIRTTSPSRTLHVVSTEWDNVAGAGVMFENSNAIGAGLTLKPTASLVANGTSGWAMYAGAPSSAIGDGNWGLWAHGNNTVPLMVSRSGDVGIGTTTAPAFTSGTGLEIQRTGTATLRLDSNTFATELRGLTGGTELYQLSAGYLDFGTNGTARVRITSSGFVGIATTSPNATLDVAGTVFISGITTVTNTTVSTSETTGAFQVRGGVGLGGSLFVGGLYTSPTQNLSLTLGTESWVKLCTLVNRCSAKIQIGTGSSNSEEEAEIEILGTYTLSGTQINVKRQTYNEHLREVRVVQSVPGGTKDVYVRLRTTDFAPSINWRLFSSRGVNTLHNIVETPGAGESLLVTTGNNFVTNAVTNLRNTTQASSTATGALQIAGGAGIGGNLYVGGTINGTFVGSISGVATTASTVTITNETASATTHFLTFVDGTDARSIKIDNGELSFVPSTGRLGIGTNTPGYKLDVRGEIYTSGDNMWFAGTTSYIRSNNIFEFLTNSGSAQSGRFKGIQLSTSYSGSIPDNGILFSTDSTLYRSAATTLRTNSSVIVDGSLAVGVTSSLARIQSTGAAATTSPTGGSSAGTGLYITNTDTGYGMMFGVAGTGRGWIQQQRSDSNTQYDLALNPIGGNVAIGLGIPTTRLTVQAAGANGIALLQDTGTATNSGRLFLQASGGTYALCNVGNVLQFSSGATIGSDTGTGRMVLNSSGHLGLGTTLSPLTYLDVRHNNSSSQASQVNGFTLRTNENGGMEWHLQHTNGYQGWVAAARVNNNGAGWGQAYLEFITAGASGGNQTSVMALHGNGNVSIGSTAVPAYKLFVNGSFAATTKSFVIDHPVKAGWKLRYASLEGPENGVYVRGRLKDDNVIHLPDYWRELVDVDSITVEITPVGKYQKLYVQDIQPHYIVVATESDMSVNCFYTVYAERKDVDKLVVEYEE